MNIQFLKCQQQKACLLNSCTTLQKKLFKSSGSKNLINAYDRICTIAEAKGA